MEYVFYTDNHNGELYILDNGSLYQVDIGEYICERYELDNDMNGITVLGTFKIGD